MRRVLGRCMTCQRQRNPCSGEQFMAALPEVGVVPEEPPFTFVGVDYVGPLEVKQGRSGVKRYGCLFTCLTTRAVHIEIAHSLDTNSMINALSSLPCQISLFFCLFDKGLYHSNENEPVSVKK